MIDVDEVMRRKDMRTVTAAEIQCLFAEVKRLRDERDDLSDDALKYERFVKHMANHLDAARCEDCDSVGEWLGAVANQYNVRMRQACELLKAETEKSELFRGPNAVALAIVDRLDEHLKKTRNAAAERITRHGQDGLAIQLQSEARLLDMIRNSDAAT